MSDDDLAAYYDGTIEFAWQDQVDPEDLATDMAIERRCFTDDPPTARDA